jgi:hypothetical protein
MKSSVDPLLFSKHFKIDSAELTKLGVLDPTLNVDTKLFPDPLLAESSEHEEMRAARATFESYFDLVRKFLLASNGDEQSVAWRTAERLLSFPEIKGTCLGYGSGSISGSGAGPEMTQKLLKTGLEIVTFGIDDPDLFMAAGLFEKDFGPDLIGDMFTNVAFENIVAFNKRIYAKLKIDTAEYKIRLKNGSKHVGQFVRNPTIAVADVPVILLPLDILRDLPVALDWAGVQEVSEQNQEFRDGLNDSMASLWSKKTLEGKEKLKAWALSGPAAFGDLLDMIHGMDGKPYDFLNDLHGELVWRNFSEKILSKYPLEIQKPHTQTHDAAKTVVETIVEQFRHLIEERDLWRELYTGDGKPRFEKTAQRLFYIAALSYCKANNLDITPEAETGRGPVDFKFSTGIDARILVEIKLSPNQIVSGFKKQLQIYNTAEQAFASWYIVIDVGGLGKKFVAVEAERNNQISAHGHAPKLILIDGSPKPSASKA